MRADTPATDLPVLIAHPGRHGDVHYITSPDADPTDIRAIEHAADIAQRAARRRARWQTIATTTAALTVTTGVVVGLGWAGTNFLDQEAPTLAARVYFAFIVLPVAWVIASGWTEQLTARTDPELDPRVALTLDRAYSPLNHRVQVAITHGYGSLAHHALWRVTELDHEIQDLNGYIREWVTERVALFEAATADQATTGAARLRLTGQA